jgi:hypothetical protein
MPTDQELEEQVEDWKRQGNEAFQKSQLDVAIQAYSQGIVQVDRLIASKSKPLLKVALLSNRAACYLKTSTLLDECIDDCTVALEVMDTTKENDTKLRGKLLYRRAKARFLRYNSPIGKKKNAEDLNLAAKDLLILLSFESSNKDATQLLQTIRNQHAVEKRNNVSNTPLGKILEAISNKDDIKTKLHNVKVLLGMLTNDTTSASMELGRLGGVDILFELASSSATSKAKKEEEEAVDPKVRHLALQCVSCAASHPPFCRNYLVGIQSQLSQLIISKCGASHNNNNPGDDDDDEHDDDIVVSALAMYLRLILHMDRDEPAPSEIKGNTLIEYLPLVDALTSAYKSGNVKIIRATLDVLSSWTAGRDRENIIRASLDHHSQAAALELAAPKTLEETRQMSPKELSDHRSRLRETRTRDAAWAFERSILFCTRVQEKEDGGIGAGSTGLDALLKCAVECPEFGLRREITVTLGKVLAAMDEDTRIQGMVAPYFGTKKVKEEKKDEKEEPGVVIEELHDDYDEEKENVEEEEEEKKPAPPVTLERQMERAELASALLLARADVGAWAIGSGWPNCRPDMDALVESNEKTAMCLAAEVLAAAASVKDTRPIVSSLLNDKTMKQLVTHQDRDIRTAAASAVAKLGLAEQETDETEIIGLLEAACYMLEDNEENVASKSAELLASKVRAPNSVATTSLERGVEVMTYLASKTPMKEEIAHGFQATPDSKHTALELLVRVADTPNAGESLTAYGLASIFQLMAVTVMTLRKESFEGKEFTMDQYDEMQKMGKTEEEKDLEKDNGDNDDTPENCAERIRRMASANVPRALCQLLEGATEPTLEQAVSALSRMAVESTVRGAMIQQGVLTGLIKVDKVEKNPSDTRKKIIRVGRHCMAKMLVSMNPGLLTSAQRMGAIKPLIQLVRDIHAKDLQQFEGLLALTNLAAAGDDTKNKIIAEKGISSLNFCMFSDHDMVKTAATEAMCNLVPHEAMLVHLRQHDTLRMWLALASDYDENYECARAAAGGLAMATQDQQIASELISLKNFKERFDTLMESGRPELMHRVFVILLNLAEQGGKYREAVVTHGFLAFSLAFVVSYNDGSKASELGFDEHELRLFNVSVDLAKQVVKACEGPLSQ